MLRLISTSLFCFCYYITTAQSLSNKYNSFYIQGQLKGRDTGIIVLWLPNDSNVWIHDTCYLAKGEFHFAGQLNEPSYCSIVGSEKGGNYLQFFLDSGKINMTLEENNFNTHQISNKCFSQLQNDSLEAQGDSIERKYQSIFDEADRLNEERKSTKDSKKLLEISNRLNELDDKKDASNEEVKQNAIQFIQTHPNSLVSPLEIYSYLINRQIETAEAEELYHQLSFAIQNSKIGKALADEMKRKSANQIAPDFTIHSTMGDCLNLHQLKGKYVLLNFWASWCSPCVGEIPDLKNLFAKYQQQGFELVNISVDRDSTAWNNALQQLKINNWHNLLTTDEISKKYSNPTSPIPSQVLINKEGIIIWNTLNKLRTDIDIQIIDNLIAEKIIASQN